jgi:hypothetical protein
MFDEELESRLNAEEIVLGGCCVSDDDPRWQCVECDYHWGQRGDDSETVRRMPDSVAEVFDALKGKVLTAHARWTLALQLFGSRDTVRFLYGFADVFFNEVKQTILADVFLKLSQLTDSARMGRYENLSLHRLIDVVEADDAKVAAKLGLNEMIQSMESACKHVREMRNQTIAHSDWSRRKVARPVTNKNEVDEALSLAARIMNAVEIHYLQSQTTYTPYPGSGDGERLVYHLQTYAKLLDETKGDLAR